MEAADCYERWLETLRAASAECFMRVAESDLRLPRAVSDEELQSRWYAGEFGWRFTTTAGAEVEIANFGRWNPDSGPVFKDAEVRFNGGPARQGGIELRGDPAAWGEVAEPEYDDTVLHLFTGGGIGGFYSQHRPSITRSGREVPQILLDITAPEFDTPPILATAQPCLGPAPLEAFDEAAIIRLLEASAQYRLLRKSARIERLSAQTSPSEGLYQSVAETLGYRHNKHPFVLLAQRFPVNELRRKIDEIEPMLFAASGFLASEFKGMPDDSRSYLKEVWNRWWPRRAELERLALPRSLWVLTGARPVNHPQRRIAALAEVARNWPVIESLIRMGDLRAIRGFFAELHHGYWEHHFTLSSKRTSQTMALIGEARVHEILANVVFPLQVGSRATSAGKQWQSYLKLPSRGDNEKLAYATRLFFAPAQHALAQRLLKRTAYQQGLLQLLDNATPTCGNPDCARCTPGERLQLWPQSE